MTNGIDLRAPALCLLSMAIAWMPLEAHAHAKLVKSEPARRAVLKHSPPQVRLWFNEKLEPSFCVLRVTDAAGKPVTDRAARVAQPEGRLLILELPALAEGTYTVAFEVLSIDGHTVKSAFAFSVRRPSGAK